LVWKVCSFSIKFSCNLHQKLFDQKCVGLFLDSQLISINWYTCLSVSTIPSLNFQCKKCFSPRDFKFFSLLLGHNTLIIVCLQLNSLHFTYLKFLKLLECLK
jgi:hypothetical protein